jgi:hypothetical protein
VHACGSLVRHGEFGKVTDEMRDAPRIEITGGDFQIDAAMVADALGVEPAVLQRRMRDGKITSRHERGTGEDEGRHRLTFLADKRRLTFVVDEKGNVIHRSMVNIAASPASTKSGKHE